MEENTTCVSCGAWMSADSRFCATCGQKRTDRLTMKGLISQLWAVVTNFEKGMWYTAEMLFLNPGKVVRDYISGRTKPYYHPFRYAFLWAAISAFFLVSTGLFEMQQADIQQSMNPNASADQMAFQAKINEVVRDYISLIVLLVLPFLALASFWFFKKRGYNKAEHLVAISYAQGHTTFFGLFVLPLYMIYPSLMGKAMFIGMGFVMAYYAYLYRSWFKLPWWRAILNGIFVYLIGFITFILFATVIGFIAGIVLVLLK